MKYIELLGLPGSGKTTLVQEVVAGLRTKRDNAFTRLDIKQATMRVMIRKKSGILWALTRIFTFFSAHYTLNLVWEKTQCPLLMRFMSEHPRLACQIIECAERIELPSWISPEVFSAEKLMKWFFDLMSVYQASHDFLDKNTMLLQEEGFCQHAYYLLAFRKGGCDEQELDTYLQLIPKPDLLVFLLTTPQQCEERMNARSKGIASDILRSLPLSQRMALQDQRLKTHQHIADYLETQNVAVIRLDNADYSTTQKILEERLAHF
jgi:thymidylate kinase